MVLKIAPGESSQQKPAQKTPTYKYKSEYKALVKQAVMLGMEFKDIASNVFNVPEEVFLQWMVDYPDFAEAAKDGGEKADMLCIRLPQALSTQKRWQCQVWALRQ